VTPYFFPARVLYRIAVGLGIIIGALNSAKTTDSKPTGMETRKAPERRIPEPAAPARDEGDTLVLDLGRGLKMEFIKIKAGTFWMGSGELGMDRENPQHRVTITHDYYLGKYLVSQEQYEQVTATNPSWFCAAGKGKDKVVGLDTRRFPVEQVSWDDAKEFCAKLSRLTGHNCDLPTEAEWEYACRAGTTTRYSFGDSPNQLKDHAWYDGNSSGRTHEVGTKLPNAWGLYDMYGNVMEWCADWYEERYYRESPKENPQGPDDGSGRILRGGSWYDSAWCCRSTSRGDFPSHRYSLVGFRVAIR
jgi:formylglycine-generating enzyme required for sulfatase activity